VSRIARDRLSPTRWQLHTTGHGDEHLVHAGFDHVVLAVTASQAREMLQVSEQLAVLSPALAAVDVAPCWTLMLAYPNAAQPGLHTLGPQWNAARSTHHRVSWLARESSKPGRTAVERWTVQASAAWSREHERDDPGACQRQAAARVRRNHRHPRHPGTRRSPPVAAGAHPGATGPHAPVGRRAWHRPVRRLVHRQSRRRRLRFRVGAGAGHG
jgi:renalase